MLYTNVVDNILSSNIILNHKYINKELYTMASDNSNNIKYKMNEHGYRSSSPINYSEYNVLTLGCSWTMGIGVENEFIWPTLVHNKINKGALFNYGMYGVSTSFISKTLFKFVSSQFIPNLVLIMWPGFSRRDYLTDTGQYRKIGGFRKAHKKDPVWKNNEEDLLFLQLQNDNQDLMKFWEAYNFVEIISRLYGIKIFHTVTGYYYDVFSELKTNLDYTINYDRFFDPVDCYKNDKQAQDNEHPGQNWHQTFAEHFYKFIEDKI